MKLLFTLLFLECALLVFPQESKVYFDDALAKHLLPYHQQSEAFIAKKDFEQAEHLFDSLVNHHLKDTYIPNLKLQKVSGGTIETDSISRPFMLITKSLWSSQDREIMAINALATNYENEVEIIVLYWDTLKEVKHLAKKFHKNVELTYIDETMNRSGPIVRSFKHSFGTPACFFVSHQKKLVFLDKKFELAKENLNQAFSPSKNTFERIAIMLFDEMNAAQGTITTLDNDEDSNH